VVLDVNATVTVLPFEPLSRRAGVSVSVELNVAPRASARLDLVLSFEHAAAIGAELARLSAEKA
jgi:hypothetical protein